MSAYNDLVRITDSMDAHHQVPRDPLALKLDKARSSMEWRYVFGIVHEIGETLKRMTKNNDRFCELERRLDNEGRTALEHLQKELQPDVSDSPDSLSKFLNSVRNKGAFHYIRDDFRKGLRDLKKEMERTAPGSTETMQDSFIIEGNLNNNRLRFIFADTARNAAAFGVGEVEKLNKQLQSNIEKVTSLVGDLNQFLQSAFIGYLELRGFTVTQTDEGFMVHA